MRDRSFRQRAFFPILVLAGFALVQTTGRTQEVSRRAVKNASQVRAVREADPRGEEAGLRRLARRLMHFRSIGDLESAARVFDRLFPSDAAGDPVVAFRRPAPPFPQTGPTDPPGTSRPSSRWRARIPFSFRRSLKRTPRPASAARTTGPGRSSLPPSNGRAASPGISGSGRARTSARPGRRRSSSETAGRRRIRRSGRSPTTRSAWPM